MRKNFNIPRAAVAAGLLVLALALSMFSGCKKSLSGGESIVVTMTQTSWGLNYSSSMGTVEIFLQGEGIDGIDLGTIAMKGDNPSTPPLKAEIAVLINGRVRVEFAKNRVLALLSHPAKGSNHLVIICFQMEQSSEPVEVTTQITVSEFGEDPGDVINLTLEVDPMEWSLNYPNSSGTVEAFIRGEGIDKIDLASFLMIGDNPAAQPLPASSATINNDQVHARFPKNQVIGILLNPTEGTTHTVIVSFLETGGSERIQLSAVITIAAEDDDEIDPADLTLEIDPNVWSMNFPKSSGTVEAFIRGEGIDQIDLGTFLMIGDNPAAQPLPASSATINNNQIHARFPKNQVIGLLLNPAEGTTHTIIVSFLETGGTERIELSAVITIEEDDDDDDDDDVDPGKLTLQLAPPDWNMNFAKSSGSVKALIRGEGIENIDLTGIEMVGDNPSAAPLAATSASLQGNHVSADFPKNQVLNLLLNPAKGTTHTVTVKFKDNGGQQLELSTQVKIN